MSTALPPSRTRPAKASIESSRVTSERDELGLAAGADDLRGRLAAGLFGDVGQDHRGARLHESLSRRETDPGGGTCHDGRFPGEIHALLLFVTGRRSRRPAD